VALFLLNRGIDMTENTYIYDRFQYFVEDCECKYCLNHAKKSETDGRGCLLPSCGFADICDDAQLHGRIKRDRGWNKHYLNDKAFKPDSCTKI
jgi:hypothetical protein